MRNILAIFTLLSLFTGLPSINAESFAGTWEAEGEGMFGMRYKTMLVLGNDGDFRMNFTGQTPAGGLVDVPFTDQLSLEGTWEASGTHVTLDARISEWKRHTGRPGAKQSIRQIQPSDDEIRLITSETEADREAAPEADDLETAKGVKEPIELAIMGNGLLKRATITFQGRFQEMNVPVIVKALAVNFQKTHSPAPEGEAPPQSDPVGEWVRNLPPTDFGICFYESGEASAELSTTDDLILLDGSWRFIEEGRWKGHLAFEGFVDYWSSKSVDITPRSQRFTFIFKFETQKLTLVHSGKLVAADGREFSPTGKEGAEQAILVRQNNNRPIRRISGNA